MGDFLSPVIQAMSLQSYTPIIIVIIIDCVFNNKC